jgi:hypothetical protein
MIRNFGEFIFMALVFVFAMFIVAALFAPLFKTMLTIFNIL